MGPGLTELVRNGTMSAEVAATLAGAVEERRSFVVFAVPRLAGKTTVTEAMLARARSSEPVRVVSGAPREISHLYAGDGRGYVVIPEISPYPVMPGYIWGEPVRRVFAVLERGYALATALHAPDAESAFDLICTENGVSDEEASRIRLAIYIRSLGAWQQPRRRVVEAVHEVDGVAGGRPRLRALHRWDRATDRFVTVNAPTIVRAERWSELAKELAETASA
ncbi:MAG: hypothetical protein KGN00_11655 [Chloroflexota bacterium]|nr:hypothetical protein [Chloroflexota bacterium]